MDAVTYSNPRTVEFVKDRMIPLRVSVSQDRIMATKFQIQYTPTIVTLDGDGKELHRGVGFYPPEELVPLLMLGIGKAYVNTKRYHKALEILANLVAQYPSSNSTPPARSLRERLLNRAQ